MKIVQTLIAVAVVAVVGVGLVGTYVSTANFGNRTEAEIKARYANNENVYANGTQRVMEIAQVPAMYAADLKAIVTASIQGRYGPNGSQATVQWLNEHNIPLATGMYEKIQNEIIIFRNQFQNSQTDLLDKCRAYDVARGNVWQGFWLKMAGYPQISLDTMCKIVTTEKARQTFETKRDTGIQLRPAN